MGIDPLVTRAYRPELSTTHIHAREQHEPRSLHPRHREGKFPHVRAPSTGDHRCRRAGPRRRLPAGGAAAAAPYYPPDDYCLGQCADVLPPGQNGNATLVDILGNQALGTYPAHSKDQLGKYADLVSGYTGLTDEQITAFFNDSSFGVPANQVGSTVSPRSDVTIVRDKATGVPHVTGTTREGTMFGAGYAGAQDRLWLMDLMRHVGRGELTPFAGGAAGNRELEQSVWRNSPTPRPTSRPRSTG
ncbi:hypothetical protein GCM10027612_59640 [Microbispora bryophytorum subsp. camponoti]